MIAKAIKGRGFRYALEYLLSESKDGRIIDSNMSNRTPRGLAKEFGVIRKLRPNLGKAVLHVSLSAAPGEHLTDDQWREIGTRYLRKMGFTDNQYVMVRHKDTEHEHIHILANRITHAGDVVSDSQDYKRQEAVMREIEKSYRLQRVQPSSEAQRKAPTRGEIQRGLRTGQPSAKQVLQRLCDAAAKNCHSFTEYLERLEAAGVEVIPVVQQSGAHISGLSYRLDGTIMKGSDLGRSYTAAGIQKKGITYEQDRDFPAVERCRVRDAARAFGYSNRDSEASQDPECGRTCRDDRAAGTRHGRPDRRDAPILAADRSAERGIPASYGRVRDHAQESLGSCIEGSPKTGAGQPTSTVEALPDSCGDGPVYSGPSDRIVSLAGPSKTEGLLERASGSPVSQARPDRSLEAVRKQIAAMGVPLFEVGIRDAMTGKMLPRTWTADDLERSVSWWKRRNARGSDIYVRPAGEHGLILLDDLTEEAVQRMKKEGAEPAAVIETSPRNFQVWLKLSDEPLDPELRKIAAQGLTKRYQGDPNSADARHFGRLAGFTNQKPEHRINGRQPYVLAWDCPGIVARVASFLIKKLQESIERKRERDKRLEAIESAQSNVGGSIELKEYKRQAKLLLEQYGKNADFSRIDWMIAKDMIKSGFTVEEVAHAISTCSPEIEVRKAGHVDDYAQRTAKNAFSSDDVQCFLESERQAARRRVQNYGSEAAPSS